MSKAIKVIDLLNKIANGEIENNTKFKIIPEDGERFICKYASGYPGYIWVIDEGNEISFNYKIDHMRILGYEVEIIEEQQDIDIQKSKEKNFEKLGYDIGKMAMEIAKGLERAIKEGVTNENTKNNK